MMKAQQEMTGTGTRVKDDPGQGAEVREVGAQEIEAQEMIEEGEVVKETPEDKGTLECMDNQIDVVGTLLAEIVEYTSLTFRTSSNGKSLKIS